MKRTGFFAAYGDLAGVLSELESAAPCRYYSIEYSLQRAVPCFRSHVDLPSLGVATGRQTLACSKYVLIAGDSEVCVQAIPVNDGVTRYCVDIGGNADSCSLWTGGAVGQEAVIAGEIATHTWDGTPDVYTRLSRIIKIRWERHRADYLGPEAMKLWKAKARLVASLDAPVEYDLA